MPFKKYRPILATVIALLFYTGTDILIWQRIFEANQMVEYASKYHAGWFLSLAGYVALGILLMWGEWKNCLFYLTSLLVTAFSGWEDMLYYILDRKPIPDSLPWLSSNPMIYEGSRTGLITSGIFWFIVLIVFYSVLYEWNVPQFKLWRRALKVSEPFQVQEDVLPSLMQPPVPVAQAVIDE